MVIERSKIKSVNLQDVGYGCSQPLMNLLETLNSSLPGVLGGEASIELNHFLIKALEKME